MSEEVALGRQIHYGASTKPRRSCDRRVSSFIFLLNVPPSSLSPEAGSGSEDLETTNSEYMSSLASC